MRALLVAIFFVCHCAAVWAVDVTAAPVETSRPVFVSGSTVAVGGEVKSSAFVVDMEAWRPFLHLLPRIYAARDPVGANATGLDGLAWALRVELLTKGFTPRALELMRKYAARREKP